MPVNIVLVDDDGCRVSIELSADGSDCTVDVGPGGVSVVVTGAVGRLSIGSGRRDRDARRARKRARDILGAGSVSPQMEAAAVRAFLEAADATRLGRSLGKVYEAMDAVRRAQDALGDGGLDGYPGPDGA